MNKWIKIHFSGATLHYKPCKASTGEINEKFDSVRNFDINGIKLLSGDRQEICPKTILSDEFRLIDNNNDVTNEIRKNNKKNFWDYIKNHPELQFVYGPDKYSSIFQPFGINQIANMFGVFINRRPVSTYHPHIIFDNGELKFEKISQELIDIVSNGFIKLDTPFYTERISNGERKVIYDVTKLNTGYPSAPKKPNIILWWDEIKINCKNEKEYADFIQMLEELSGECNIENKYIHFNEFIYNNLIPKIGIEKVKCALKKSGKGGMLKRPEHNDLPYINREENNTFCGHKKFFSASETSYPAKTIKLSGSFIFKVPEDMYTTIINGKKMAIYLENGCAELGKMCKNYGADEKYYNEYDFVNYYHISDVIAGKTEIGKIKLNK